MKISALSQYLHELRYSTYRKAIGYRMTAMEVWELAVQCQKNGIDEIFVKTTRLPDPFDGMFVRLTSSVGVGDKALVLVREDLPSHWKEFVIIKELMHCWSPASTYVSTPERVKSHVSAIVGPAKKYTASVAADTMAVVAAAEVMLPLFALEREIAKGISVMEIAHRHNLHHDIAEMLCDLEMIAPRKHGSL